MDTQTPNPTSPVNERLLRVPQLAELFDVVEDTVWRWIREGQLPAIHIGRNVRVSERDLAAFIEAGRRR